MRLSPQHCALFSALTLVVACGDDTVSPIQTGGAGGGAGEAAGGTGAGMAAGGSSAGMVMTAGTPAMAGTPSTAGMAGSGGAGGSGGAAGAAGSAGAGGEPVVPVCGNGVKEGTEACDDKNTAGSDGCSANCMMIEAGYACPTAGVACTPICGDGKKIAPETCDDKNVAAGDGCSAKCTTEQGWMCATEGQACTSVCGDGFLVGKELCDDKNTAASDGCDASCKPEAGFVCDLPGESCRKQPDCTGGICTSVCGDGLVIGEECDDGNTETGDGCNAACKIEPNFNCEIVAGASPDKLAIPATYRDFIATPAGGSIKFPDQIAFQGAGITPGMVEPALVGGLPVYTGICEAGGPNVNDAAKCPHGAQSTSQANFDMWYRDTADINLAFPGVVPMTKVDGSDPVAYVFDGGTQFTPLTGIGWDAQGKEGLTENKNFGFTTELRYFFKYHGDEKLDFSGDDDVWVFINNKLAVDIGGLHPPQTKSVTLGAVVSNQLDLDPDVVYELVLFHAERRPNGSNFKLTLTGFLNETSVCTPK